MATLRHHARIDAPASDIWALVRDPAGIKDWLPVDDCTMEGDTRVVGVMGVEIREDIVTVDDDLMRLQYSITESPLPITSHLASIDVLEDEDGAVVVYHCDVSPDDAAPILDGTLEAGVKALVDRFGG